jgi:hypothetical protein
LNIHQVAPQQPILLATLTIDVALVAEAGIYDLPSRPLVSTELLRALEHIFAIGTILNITTTTSAEIFAAFFRLVDAGASLHCVHTLRP